MSIQQCVASSDPRVAGVFARIKAYEPIRTHNLNWDSVLDRMTGSAANRNDTEIMIEAVAEVAGYIAFEASHGGIFLRRMQALQKLGGEITAVATAGVMGHNRGFDVNLAYLSGLADDLLRTTTAAAVLAAMAAESLASS